MFSDYVQLTFLTSPEVINLRFHATGYNMYFGGEKPFLFVLILNWSDLLEPYYHRSGS